MNLRVVIINGTGASGKDTFVMYCGEHGSVYNLSTIDRVKEAAKVLGWRGDEHDKSPEARHFLSDIKDSWVRFNNGSFTDVTYRVARILADPIEELEGDIPVFFIHAREPEEIQKLKRHYGDIAVTLIVKGRDSGEGQTNHADLNVDNYPYAYEVDNSGTLEELNEKARIFMQEILNV